MAGFAVLNLVCGELAPIWDSIPTWLPWPQMWIYGSAAALLAASAGLFGARTARASAVVIAAYLTIWAGSRVGALLLKPLFIGSWYGFGEALAPLTGAWTLYAMLGDSSGKPSGNALSADCALRAARILFGAACIVFGAAHFAYATYTAAMVPAWLPAGVAFVYLTGAAHAAAGLGLLAGVLERTAATLEAVMMSSFGVLVWLPSFFAHPVPKWATPLQYQWSETLITCLLAASAGIVAAALRTRPEPR